ncbi:MAG: hypothetical protein KDD47_20915, partial [Acidobacteria bacterium]|nr:hypothetical protein [Acidobacteriota bacterium]
GVALLAVAPFLLFCTLRLAVVGQFGLVAFGGYNLIGLAGSMLDEELISELPAEQQSLAQDIYQLRKRASLYPMRPETPTRKFYSQFNDNVWQRAVPLLEKRLGRREVSSTAINRELAELSRAILRRRPRLYLKWIVDSFVYGIGEAAVDFWIVGLGLALLLASPLLLLPAASGTGAQGGGSWPLLLAFAFVAGLYVAGSLGLIVLVEVPFGRYMSTVALLVPSALALALFEVLRLGRPRLLALRKTSP